MNDRLRKYVAGIEDLAHQPLDSWQGWAQPRHESMNFGLRFQIAFSGYALGALAVVDESVKSRCLEALGALIERYLSRPVWAYWRDAGGGDDPVAQANIQYSGHLGHLIGLYEVLGGDDRFDQPWEFAPRVTYTHQRVVEAIHRQMLANPYHGVECEPGCTYVSCNDHALWTTTLYDRCHGTNYAHANEAWLRFLQDRLIFSGPHLPGRGAVTAIYSTRFNAAAPLGLNFMDAWSLAMLAPLAPTLVKQLAGRVWARLKWQHDDSALLPSATVWQRMEGSDAAVNTGFAFVLAVETGERAIAAALLRYAERCFQLVETGTVLRWNAGIAPPYTSALFALGEAGGAGTVLHAAVPTSRHQRSDEP